MAVSAMVIHAYSVTGTTRMAQKIMLPVLNKDLDYYKLDRCLPGGRGVCMHPTNPPNVGV